MTKRFTVQSSPTAAHDIRVNTDLSNLHHRVAVLLQKFADDKATSNDKAMARIYTTQLERRRRNS